MQAYARCTYSRCASEPRVRGRLLAADGSMPSSWAHFSMLGAADQAASCVRSGVYVVMVMRASIKNPTTGKTFRDLRACHVLQMVDGKLARFDDFAGDGVA